MDRLEKDSFGEISVPEASYWGAQTQRSIELFQAGTPRDVWSREVIWALGVVKKAAAQTNSDLGVVDSDTRDLIIKSADVVMEGGLDKEFPLVYWQTGSGTQTNMNANEVIANYANKLHGSELGSKYPIHPNDHVNMSQSSNDVFPTVMHLATIKALKDKLLSEIDLWIQALDKLQHDNEDVIKVGRTHLMDAVPITMGQEISGWKSSLVGIKKSLEINMEDLYSVALGGTAVGTGINAHPEFASRVAEHIANITGYPIITASNKFEALSLHNPLVNTHSLLKTLATTLVKISNDIRWMASGPNTGLSEITIPANEPGSSIMPGKVNPTQAEALIMISYQVMGNDVAVGLGNASGNFELNVAKPLILCNLLNSIDLLASGMRGFRLYCLVGMKPNTGKIDEYNRNSLMAVTALAPHIGYDLAAKIVELAGEKRISIKEAAFELNIEDTSQFDTWLNPKNLV